MIPNKSNEDGGMNILSEHEVYLRKKIKWLEAENAENLKSWISDNGIVNDLQDKLATLEADYNRIHYANEMNLGIIKRLNREAKEDAKHEKLWADKLATLKAEMVRREQVHTNLAIKTRETLEAENAKLKASIEYCNGSCKVDAIAEGTMEE